MNVTRGRVSQTDRGDVPTIDAIARYIEAQLVRRSARDLCPQR